MNQGRGKPFKWDRRLDASGCRIVDYFDKYTVYIKHFKLFIFGVDFYFFYDIYPFNNTIIRLIDGVKDDEQLQFHGAAGCGHSGCGYGGEGGGGCLSGGAVQAGTLGETGLRAL
ncbi:MAG: hypothetical protein ACE15F_21290, partial [bacterium]